MVQGQYGLRARAVLGRRRRGELSAEDLLQPAAAATIGAGLQPGVMTKAERLAFGGRHAEYLDARCARGGALRRAYSLLGSGHAATLGCLAAVSSVHACVALLHRDAAPCDTGT